MTRPSLGDLGPNIDLKALKSMDFAHVKGAEARISIEPGHEKLLWSSFYHLSVDNQAWTSFERSFTSRQLKICKH